MLACRSWYDPRMKFTSYLTSNSIDILNFRVSIRSLPCQHCHCAETVVSHGYLRGLADQGNNIVTRGLRFFAPIAMQI
jgi:hypothetical protein